MELERKSGTPQSFGWTRAPRYDRLPSDPSEVWKRPDGILIALPPRTKRITLQRVVLRGRIEGFEDWACVEPPGAVNIWPEKRRALTDA